MINVNDYKGASDSDRIEAAIRDRRGRVVVISRRESEIEPERDWWLLDRAILLPADTTVIIRNCKIKLSDRCRDNFFRSANCGIGIANPEPISNIHIRGVGDAVLEGADHPRSTGDSSKILARPCPKNFSGSPNPTFEDFHRHTYGTDAGKEGESQNGDWRNIGVLMANVDHLSIDNIRIIEPHAWSISLEKCSNAKITRIEFKACMTRVIDGAKQNVENQDGINLRNSCHDVLISDITGPTGDDVVALTAIASQEPPFKGGSFRSTHVMSNDYSDREKGIHNVIIRNILAYPAGGCAILRFLATDGAEIRNVSVDNIVDTSPDDHHGCAGILVGAYPGEIGEPGCKYGDQQEYSLFNINISNLVTNTRCSLYMPGGLVNSTISNIVNRNPSGMAIDDIRPDLKVNVKYSNICDCASNDKQ